MSLSSHFADRLRRAAHSLKGAAANFDAADTVAAAAPPLIAALPAFGGSGSCES